MGEVFLFALTAALNPTLLTAVTVMLVLDRPQRLLMGYLIGAALTSITCGVLLVFALPHSSTSGTAKHTVDPVLNLVLGALVLVVVGVVATGRDKRRRAWSERRREAAKNKPPPRWRRVLSKGSARDAFGIGVVLSFPGASYIAGMSLLSKENVSTAETVLVIIAFNAIMLLLLELPLVAYAVEPERAARMVSGFSSWLTRSGGRLAMYVGTAVGVLLIARGIVNW